MAYLNRPDKRMEINHEIVKRCVVRAQRGRSEGFAELYKIYFSPLYFYALRQLENEEYALDAVQETFLYALLHLRDLHDPQAFHKWIYTIAASRITDAKRRLVREHATFTYLPEQEGNKPLADAPEEQEELMLDNILIGQDGLHQLQMMIGHLTVVQREAVILHYFADFSHAEIADILGISEATVRKRLHDARMALATRISPRPVKTPEPVHAGAAQTPAATPVYAQATGKEYGGFSADNAKTSVAAKLGLVLPLMLQGAQMDPMTKKQVRRFAQQVT